MLNENLVAKQKKKLGSIYININNKRHYDNSIVKYEKENKALKI